MSGSDEWLGDAQTPASWRDMMVRVTGRMAQRLQGVFAASWVMAHGELLAGDAYYPAIDAATEEGGRVQFLSVASSPSEDAHPLRSLYWMSFACATRSIDIANAYFVPDNLVRAVLKRKAQEGVAVRIMVPNRHTDVPPVLWAGRAAYEELLSAGVRIYEYQPTMLHSKYVVIDGVWSVVGSANMDIRSKELNEENVLGIADTRLAQELVTSFENDLAQAKEIQLATWRTRGTWWRVKELAATLFAEQF